MSEHPFDSLARTLAGGASRRGVLRALGGVVLGGLVAAPAQTVLAAGNSACAHFCASVFGADTTAANQCTSDAAHGKGLCSTCGPASPGGGISPSAICCARNGRGVCSSYSSAACCKSPQTCGGGGTAGVCGCTPTTCPPGVCGHIANGCGGTLTCTCGTGQICSRGQCVTPTTTTPACLPTGASGCSNGTQCCSGVCCGGTCVNLLADDANCGACGTPCNPNQVCQSSTCCFTLGNPCAPSFGDYCCPGLVCTNSEGGTCVAAV